MNLVSITRLVSRGALLVQKHAPEILTAVGVVGGVTASVMAVKEAKMTGIGIEYDHYQGKEDIKDKEARGYYDSKSDKAKDLLYLYKTTTQHFFKTYGPAIALGTVSIGCVLWGHGILKARNATLTAAYAALDQAFAAYRERAKEVIGETNETDIYAGTTQVKTEGQPTVHAPTSHGVYTRIFDEGSINWSKTPEYNKMFLMTQQNYFNDRLRSKGHVFLNEVLEALGFPHTPIGAIVGWVYDPEDPNHPGDNYIDFGLFDNDQERNAFLNSWERSVWLEFNVDGVIFEKI